MRQTTLNLIKESAPKILRGDLSNPTPIYEQRMVQILEILKANNDWLTTVEIASQIGVSRYHARDILQACKLSWGLASSPKLGWMLVKKDSAIIV